VTEILPGIWRFRCGEPEAVTPVVTRSHPPAEPGLAALPQVPECPVPVTGRATSRGYVVSIPLEPYEQVYGLGLQLQSFAQRGSKKTLRVNADPKLDSGDTHAPVPFYVTTKGYGVLVDTARYATFYCGNSQREMPRSSGGVGSDALPAAYRAKGLGAASDVRVEIPLAGGADVYVFAGPSMRQAIARSNLFAGGGALPPPWGLGVWYRTYVDFDQSEVVHLAESLRERQLPCDVIGLEPGWQTQSYSCSYAWSDAFPDPRGLIQELRTKGFRLNLWEHAFVHPESELREPLRQHSGDIQVWGGLVPDFCGEPARELFADLHRREHIALGVSGYKLDECDNSDYTGSWSFPELSTFPSGVDGEQMHSLFGLRYQDTITSAFDGERTYGLVRSSHALAAPYPYVLYSDLYDHREFVRALANSGFSGLLWTPELRDAADAEDLLRRLQTAVLSPMALINAWYIRNPPWLQTDREANNRGEFDPEWPRLEEQCRRILQLRMQLVPYLHAAFVRYQREGIPPFRALVVDHPDDPETWLVDDQYLMGEAFLVAPLFAGESGRSVYLPAGGWFDFWTGQRYDGGRRHDITAPPDRIPLFVRSGSAIPLAEPTDAVPENPRITVRAYGPDAPDEVTLYADDGSASPGLTEIRLHAGNVIAWETVE
jgi:alpha-D-xyloside xylohydrolase